MKRICLLIVPLLLLVCLPALTQTITGTITGLVTDQSGAVVAGAKVTAVNVLTGVVTPTVTNPSGVYSLRFLQIGQYKVSVESSGFSPQSTSAFLMRFSSCRMFPGQVYFLIEARFAVSR